MTERAQRSAHDYALDLLSQRAYTRVALERKLRGKDFAASEIADEIDSLEQSGLIDDDKYAEEYSRQQLTTRRKSVRRVTLELIKKGIAADRVKVAMKKVLESESIDTDASLRQAAEKKMASLIGLDPRAQRQRLFGYLARQGFELDDIKKFVSEPRDF
jgi:regulatory protein